jgi:hypothetical protein
MLSMLVNTSTIVVNTDNQSVNEDNQVIGPVAEKLDHAHNAATLAYSLVMRLAQARGCMATVTATSLATFHRRTLGNIRVKNQTNQTGPD